jgi:hypothetical protein
VNHYVVRAIVRDRDAERMVISEETFHVYFAYGTWETAWHRDYGDRWKLQEILSVEAEQPEESLV